jgi:hypothetical protein
MHFPRPHETPGKGQKLLCDEGLVNKHSRVHNRVFGTKIFLLTSSALILSPIRPGVFVYLRYLNFIYSVCAFQMAYITLAPHLLTLAHAKMM